MRAGTHSAGAGPADAPVQNGRQPRTAPPMRGRTARAWIELDLDALRHNARVLQAALPENCRLMAVLKANAYGHGLAVIGRALSRAGVRGYAVATLEEGILLRKSGVRGEILILGYTPAGEARRLFFWRLTQTVADAEHARALSAAGLPLRVHIALDTGMHRLGLPADTPAALAALGEVYTLPRLKITGTYSHLCTVECAGKEAAGFVQKQTGLFFGAVAWLRAAGLEPGRVHLQASYGILELPGLACGYARAGVALLGTVRPDTAHPLPLQPVLSLKARIASVRTIAPGETAGYARAFAARRETRIATVSIGFVDGVPRGAGDIGGGVGSTGKGNAENGCTGACLLLHGRRVPVVGRLCMDQLLLDVTELPDAAPGDIVTVIGKDGTEEVTALELAGWGSTVPELLGRLGQRLPRIPVEGAAVPQ